MRQNLVWNGKRPKEVNINPRENSHIEKVHFTKTEPRSFILDNLHVLNSKQIMQAYFMLVPYCLIQRALKGTAASDTARRSSSGGRESAAVTHRQQHSESCSQDAEGIQVTHPS